MVEASATSKTPTLILTECVIMKEYPIGMTTVGETVATIFGERRRQIPSLRYENPHLRHENPYLRHENPYLRYRFPPNVKNLQLYGHAHSSSTSEGFASTWSVGATPLATFVTPAWLPASVTATDR